MDARTIADPLPLAKALIACRSITPAEPACLTSRKQRSIASVFARDG